MNCQHCQTWNIDDDHRCRRCGRRLRAVYGEAAPERYPVSAAATAPAYDFLPETRPAIDDSGQQVLFAAETGSRVIPFESLTTPVQRTAIEERVSQISRPEPLKMAKVEVSPRQSRSRSRKSRKNEHQRRFDFLGEVEVGVKPQSAIICDAVVAPVAMRLHAAIVDSLIMGTGCALIAVMFHYLVGSIVLDKRTLPVAAAVFALVPVIYRLLWSYANLDSLGMRAAGLRLVDFDGNPPARERRYLRTFGGFISLLAAGMGIVWMLVDEDGLSWHDHMSSTFPTLA